MQLQSKMLCIVECSILEYSKRIGKMDGMGYYLVRVEEKAKKAGQAETEFPLHLSGTSKRVPENPISPVKTKEGTKNDEGELNLTEVLEINKKNNFQFSFSLRSKGYTNMP